MGVARCTERGPYCCAESDTLSGWCSLLGVTGVSRPLRTSTTLSRSLKQNRRSFQQWLCEREKEREGEWDRRTTPGGRSFSTMSSLL